MNDHPWNWRPIETAPTGRLILLYFPAQAGRNALCEMIKTDHYPVNYPRKPTHWVALPPQPIAKAEGKS